MLDYVEKDSTNEQNNNKIRSIEARVQDLEEQTILCVRLIKNIMFMDVSYLLIIFSVMACSTFRYIFARRHRKTSTAYINHPLDTTILKK